MLNSELGTTIAQDCNQIGVYGKTTIHRIDGSTLNSPQKQGIISASGGSVLTYLNSVNFGSQLAMIAGLTDGLPKICLRAKNSGQWSAWDLCSLSSEMKNIISPPKSFDANDIPSGISFFEYQGDTLHGPSAESVFGYTMAGVVLAYKYSDKFAVELALAAGIPGGNAGLAIRAKDNNGWNEWKRISPDS